MIRLCLIGLLLLAGCKKVESKAAAEADDHGARRARGAKAKQVTMEDLPPLEVPEPSTAAYKPTASEVPLAEDFASAADKRVTVDNYRQELVTIEKELTQLATPR